MGVRTLYLLAAIAGTLIPYYFLFQFIRDNGFNLALLVEQMFATPIAAFFVMDVIISSIVLWIFIFSEGRRLGMKRLWIYVMFNLLVGVSLALPAFLYAREKETKQNAAV